MNKKKLTREIITKTLVKSLEPIDYIHAFWEGGAAAFSRINQWSDIDLYLVVDDERIVDAVFEVERTLKSLSPIRQKYEPRQTIWSEIFQAFYRMENTNKYLLIDLAVIKMSSPEKFLEPEIHGNAVFFFNKFNKIKIPRLDDNAITKKLWQRFSLLKTRFEIFNIFVQKEIYRGNALEAMDLYYNVTLAILVEVLRIKYFPLHHDFKTRYIHFELPASVIDKLEYLCFVKGILDLQKKYREATEWCKEEIRSLAN
ncbi:MAG: hypothetical protein NWE84_03625 [Candidatus Bathyarchaeota archaeon]|nr:hypothetical protein [Candidatus Bathyarchaeota archaeon]